MDGMNETERPAPAAALLPVLLAGAWRFRFLIALAVCGGALVGAFFGLVIPNQYQSVGKLFVRPGIREALAPEAAFGAAGARTSLGIREAVQNAMQVLGTPDLFDKIVERVGVDVLLAPYDPAGNATGPLPWHTALFHALQSWWFAAGGGEPQTDVPVDRAKLASLLLQQSILIAPEPGASVITFSYTSHSPELARDIVNAALGAATDLHREVFATMAAIGAMEEEAKTEELSARDAEKALRDFRIEKGIYDYERQQTDIFSYVNTIDHQMDDIGIDVKRREAERSALAEALKLIPAERTLLSAQNAGLNPFYSGLLERLSYLQTQLLRLDVEIGTMSPAEVTTRKEKLNEQIRSTRLELDQTKPYLEGVKEENPNHLRIAQRILDLSGELVGLTAQRDQLAAVRSANQARLRELEALAPTVRTLEEDAKQKRLKADRLAEGVANGRTVQRLEQLNLSDIRLMHLGTLDPNKIAPRRGPMVFQWAFLAGGLGVALAFLLTLLDSKVRIREDLIRLGLPADGVVEDARSPAPPNGCVLPESLADARADIARFWAELRYERRGKDRFRIAFVPCGNAADTQRAAAALAIGLAAHGGERVAYVDCTERGTWLAQRLGLPVDRGWSDVVRGELTLEKAEIATPIPGLTFLAAGDVGAAVPHPMATSAFAGLLDALVARHRFVIVDLPDLQRMPEARAVLGIVDAAQLVACKGQTTKSEVRQALAAVRVADARPLGAVLQNQPGSPSKTGKPTQPGKTTGPKA